MTRATVVLMALAAAACSEPLEFADWTIPVPEGTPVHEYPTNPVRLAPLALRLSLLLYPFGSKNGGLAAWVSGTLDGARVERKIALVTEDDGPATPSAPAILLARKILMGPGLPPGAYPCLGTLELGELRAHLEPKGIWCARGEGAPEDPGRWERISG